MFNDFDQLLTFDLFDTVSPHERFEWQDGERREVSILFADIHGFTALSERLDSEQVRMIWISCCNSSPDVSNTMGATLINMKEIWSWPCLGPKSPANVIRNAPSMLHY